ncbi:DUF5615 family PIN-like protein [Nibricoccus sp. IMCC34717]|uniref:DUF5615 family PIN-like protein n=1 Tax=Nibricoccus sp. IMCC34717 TaxID=3034021 RepID=UPI0038509FB5
MRLVDLFPGSTHVKDLGLAESSDEQVWSYAKANGLVVVSKDTDFLGLAFLYGPPPKVIRITLGNCSVADLENLFRSHRDLLERFDINEFESVLLLP